MGKRAISSVASKTSNSNRKPYRTDRHTKIDGRDRRISIPPSCADRILDLKEKLGHENAGQTIEWLMIQAKTAIDVVIGTNPSPAWSVRYPSSVPVHLCPPLPPTLSPKSIQIVPGEASASSMDGLDDFEVDISVEEIVKFLDEFYD